jgi:hypothetical protein
MSYGFARMPLNRWLLWSAITVSGNWRRQASVPRMDGWSAEDVFIPSADNFEDERGLGGGAVDHSRQTCHQPGQLPIVCHTVPDRHVPVAHPILSTASVHRSTERTNSHPLKTRLRTARTNAASISLQHDCLRTTRSPPHSSQYGGEPAACKESCNSTPTMIVRVCLLPAPVGKARRSESPGAAVSARLFASIPWLYIL